MAVNLRPYNERLSCNRLSTVKVRVVFSCLPTAVISVPAFQFKMILFVVLVVCFINTLHVSADSDTMVTSKAYLDISIANKAVGKIVIGLFGKTNPKTVKNFEALAAHTVG